MFRIILISGLVAAALLAEQDASTPLHQAVEQDDLQAAQALIRKGVDVKALTRYGIAPLSIACTNGNSELVELLLNAGADPNTATPEGETALMTASRTGNLAVVRALLAREARVNEKEKWRGQTALMWAAAEGHLAVTDRLLEGGADTKARSNAGFTAFLFAVREGKLDLMRTLLKAGADPNESLPARGRRRPGYAEESTTVKAGSSALHIAVTNAHFELASVLLNAGANPNGAGPGWTALHAMTWTRKPGAASNDPAPPGSGSVDSLDFVRKLVAKGADVNARMTARSNAGLSALEMIGATPFLMAARTADADLMRLLAKLGADPLLTTNGKSTPLMVAAGVGTRSPGEDAGTELEVLEAVQVALELGNDVNAVDDYGDTAMHGAAYKHLPNVCRYLADHGAKIEIWNRKNKQGWTPLRIAEGVHRTGNLRASASTAAELRKIMSAAGVSTEVEPETMISGSTK